MNVPCCTGTWVSCGILHQRTRGFCDNTMAEYFSVIRARYLHAAAILCLAAAALATSGGARAVTRADLYQATVPLADRSEAAQSAAYQAALKSVLVRVTGRRSAEDDPALEPLISNARRYVQQYRGTADNQVSVVFDGPAIERWLTQNGQPLWGRERPSTFVWLAVQSGPQSGSVMTADDASELKAAISAAAQLRGVPLVWPSAAELQRDHMDYTGVNNIAPSALADIGRRAGCEGTLIGHAGGNASAAMVHWTHLFQDRISEFTGALEGVNRAADLYAGLFAASGNLVPVDIEVIGVEDLREYANLQTYLESLTFISHVSVQAVSGDRVKFRLSTRGGIESLQRALSLNGRLQPIVAGDDAIQRFQLRR